MSPKTCILNQESRLARLWPTKMDTKAVSERLKVVQRQMVYTHDVPIIERYNGHLVFVYGTLKDGFSKHYLLKQAGAQFVSVASSQRPYSLFKHTQATDPYPILLPQYRTHPVGSVIGQLYMVKPSTIYELDRFEQNQTLFRRLKLHLQILTKPHNSMQIYSTLYAWTYMGIPEVWRDMIDIGTLAPVKPCQIYKDNTGPNFINFTYE